ncbi:MAG: glycosyltransferase family 4 protein [Candidatus Bathyarchaeia archaeon]
MRIAIVRTTLHRASGQTVHIRELALRLIRMGHEVTLFSRKTEGELGGISIERVSFPLESVPFIRHFGFAASCGVRVRDFDVVHTQYHPGILAGNYLKRMRGVPHVFTYHGYAPVTVWRNPIQRIKMVDHRVGTFFALKLGISQVITVSHYLRDELERFYGLDPTRIWVTYNGVDLRRFNPRVDGTVVREKYKVEDKPVILYLGRLAFYKGPQYLIRAAPHVLREVPKAKFLIAGSARYDFPDLKDLAHRLGVSRSILFTGYVPNSELPGFYAACDVFCYPSLWEGFGLTPAEAQACGKPVVAFDHCAVPEVVSNGETGILVSPRDHIALAKAIIDLLTDHEKRVEMGVKGEARVRKLFRWEKVAAKTAEVYERALERGRA